MKKHFFFLLIVLLATGTACFSQVNAYFADSPMWKIKTVAYPDGSSPERVEDIFNYYTAGDTLIGSLIYKKIFKKGIYSHYNYSGMPLSSSSYASSAPYCFLRSDSTKMYMRYPSSADILLFDYDLSIGDTVPSTQPMFGTPDMTVVSIDSVLTVSGYRKRFLISASGGSLTTYLYEGAGSSGGLAEPALGYFLSGTTELQCYSLNDSTYFPSPGPTCELILEVPAIKNDLPGVSVFPNPFSGKTTFECAQDLKETVIEIIDINGRIVKTIIFSGKKAEFYRGELDPGFYFYRINSEEHLHTGKLIITDIE